MRVLNIDTTKYSIEELKALKKKVPYKSRIKIQVIILAMEGKQAKEIALYLDLCDDTVGAYIKKFNKGGIDCLLHISKSSGRPPKLTQEQQNELKEVIKKSPQEVGFGTSVNWTCGTISDYIKEVYKVEMTETGVYEMLVRNKMSYTRTTYVLKKSDQTKQEMFNMSQK